MTIAQFIAKELKSNLDMLKMTLADFSDADMLVRPTPGANHAAWQLGHLAAAEPRHFAKVAPGAHVPVPAGFAEKFTKDTTGVDDPAKFPTKAEILDVLERNRLATIKYVETLTDADLEKPSEQPWAPTLGKLAIAEAIHTTMHIGQFQVIRRKLGKPVLF